MAVDFGFKMEAEAVKKSRRHGRGCACCLSSDSAALSIPTTAGGMMPGIASRARLLRFVCAALFVTAAVRSSACSAWGERGHSIIAEIGQRHLNAKAAEAVRLILADNSSLASISSWADDFKFTAEGLKSKSWHFVDIDDSHDAYSSSDCGVNGCLVTALTEQVAILSDASKPLPDRRQALLYVVHFVGDFTQPFHCSQRTNDGGANGIPADFEGAGPDGKPMPKPKTNLHAVWDDALIDAHTYNWGSYVNDLERRVVPDVPAPSVAVGFAELWVNETHAVAHQLYALTPVNAATPVRIDSDYQRQVQPILDRQLAIGGVRLAALLNNALGQ